MLLKSKGLLIANRYVFSNESKNFQSLHSFVNLTSWNVPAPLSLSKLGMWIALVCLCNVTNSIAWPQNLSWICHYTANIITV